MPSRNSTESERIAAVELGRGLEWALYWIGRIAEVPLPLEEEDEYERWTEAKAALRRWGPESDAGVNWRLPAELRR